MQSWMKSSGTLTNLAQSCRVPMRAPRRRKSDTTLRRRGATSSRPRLRLSVWRQNGRAQCAAETAEEELRELLRRNKEEHAAIEARLRVEIEREKKARVEAEDFLRQESERERTERAATENLLRESLAQEKNERAKMEEELREALNRERSERGDIETDLREKLRREIKGRVETEEKLHLRVSELEAEIASQNIDCQTLSVMR